MTTARNDRFNRRSDRSSVGSRRPEITATEVLNRILYGAVVVLTFPVRVINWLTQPPGNAILFGLATAYFYGLNLESYWQAVVPDAPSFIPKPFITDGANPLFFFLAAVQPGFWVTSLLAIAIQALETSVLRDISLNAAKAEYDAIKDHEVPEPNPKSVDLAEYKRRRYQSAGMKSIRIRGFIVLLAYGVDIAVAIVNFPLFGVKSFMSLLGNLVWILLSVFGAEAASALFIDALEKGWFRVKVGSGRPVDTSAN